MAVTDGNVRTAVEAEDWNSIIQGSQPVGRQEFLGQSEETSRLDLLLNRPNPWDRRQMQRQSHLQVVAETTDGAGLNIMDPHAVQPERPHLGSEVKDGLVTVIGSIFVACAMTAMSDRLDALIPAQEWSKTYTPDQASQDAPFDWLVEPLECMFNQGIKAPGVYEPHYSDDIPSTHSTNAERGIRLDDSNRHVEDNLSAGGIS